MLACDFHLATRVAFGAGRGLENTPWLPPDKTGGRS